MGPDLTFLHKSYIEKHIPRFDKSLTEACNYMRSARVSNKRCESITRIEGDLLLDYRTKRSPYSPDTSRQAIGRIEQPVFHDINSPRDY